MKFWIFGLAFVSSAILADFDKAMTAYQKEHYQTAYNEFLTLAKLGEKKSQFNLGVMYYQGQHVEKNLETAYAWIKLSLKGQILDKSHNQTLDIIKKVVNLEKAESVFQDLESKYGAFALTKTLYPKVLPGQKAKTLAKPVDIVTPKYPKEAAMRGIEGYVKFSFNLDGYGRTRNIVLTEAFPQDVFERAARKAIKNWTFEVAEQQNSERLSYTMEFKLSGSDGLKPKPHLYHEQVKKAQQGDIQSMFTLGLMQQYFTGLSDHGMHVDSYFKAATKGHAGAQYQLGKSLLKGEGCDQDVTKAVSWLSIAAASGNIDAQKELGQLLAKKEDLNNQKLAIRYLENVLDYDKTMVSHLRLIDLYITSSHDEIRNTQKAIDTLNAISWGRYYDDITEYETKAKVAFASGNIKEAIVYQQEALDEAEDEGYYTDEIKKKLNEYRAIKKQAAL